MGNTVCSLYAYISICIYIRMYICIRMYIIKKVWKYVHYIRTCIMMNVSGSFTVILLYSGEVYAFGHGKHGQLGQGNNKDR